MAFLLCHDCFCWVEPSDGRCPECQHTVDPSASDPPTTALRAAIGSLDRPLGSVRVPRRLLPELGTLYATSNGLCFVPHQPAYETRQVEGPGAATSLFWTLATILWSPLMFIAPFARSKQVREQRVQIFRPRELDPEDGDRLPYLLMQDPGVFFIPRRLVRSIRRRRHRWLVARTQGPTLRLDPADDRHDFHHRMGELLSSTPWQGLGAV